MDRQSTAVTAQSGGGGDMSAPVPRRPRLLDLFSGAGGSAMGYYRAGFDVEGVDHVPQKHYPFPFHLGDALEYVRAHGHEYDAIHASPPCQGYSRLRHVPQNRETRYPLLIEATRRELERYGRPWVMENVEGSPLVSGITLCGIMFGLRVYRHRCFECSHLLIAPTHLQHPVTIGSHRLRRGALARYGENEHGFVTVAGHMFSRADGAAAMGIGWMTRDELAEAIPPAYTEYTGHQLLQAVCPEEAVV